MVNSLIRKIIKIDTHWGYSQNNHSSFDIFNTWYYLQSDIKILFLKITIKTDTSIRNKDSFPIKVMCSFIINGIWQTSDEVVVYDYKGVSEIAPKNK